jgi:peptidoglycan/LPS O-acetylase OafA/YrhL
VDSAPVARPADNAPIGWGRTIMLVTPLPHERPDRRLDELEGLRGACATLVVLSHWGEFFRQREGIVASLAEIPRPFGFLAVVVFFMLSGFVIGRATPAARSGRAVADYLQRRFIRLYPIYLVALVASFVVAGKPLASGEFLLHAVFLQNAAVETVASNGPLWSLDNEVAYYLVFVVVLLVPRAVYALFGAAIGGVIFAAFRPDWYFNLIGLAAFWLAGLMLATGVPPLRRLVTETNAPRFWVPTFLLAANMATGAWPALLKTVGINAGLTFIVAINGVLLFDVFASVLGRAVARYWVPFYVLSAASTGIALAHECYAGTIATMPSAAVALAFFILAGLASRFAWPSPTPAQWAKLSAIGVISYGLYVIHYPILFAAKAWFPESWTAVLLAVPASFAAAAMLEGVMQPRVRRWWSGLIATTRGARGSDVVCRAGGDVFLPERREIKRARAASARLPAMDMSGP